MGEPTQRSRSAVSWVSPLKGRAPFTSNLGAGGSEFALGDVIMGDFTVAFIIAIILRVFRSIEQPIADKATSFTRLELWGFIFDYFWEHKKMFSYPSKGSLVGRFPCWSPLWCGQEKLDVPIKVMAMAVSRMDRQVCETWEKNAESLNGT